jgi:hypothetical protein
VAVVGLIVESTEAHTSTLRRCEFGLYPLVSMTQTLRCTAYMWFNLAAAQLADMNFFSDDAASYRDKVAALMTLAQIAEAQQRARDWKPFPDRCPSNENLTP